MIELRIHGLPADVETTLAKLRASFVILSETKPFPDRAPSKRVRMYVQIKAEPPLEELDVKRD